jgi:hypothetical protein
MDNILVTFNRFDQVKLLTTKNVKYLSAPPGTNLDPRGVWQVSAAVDGELLLVKNNIVIKIPTSDVLKVVEYDLSKMTQQFGNMLGKDNG